MDIGIMEKNKTQKKKRRTELILLVFVLVSMGLILVELFSNIFTQLAG